MLKLVFEVWIFYSCLFLSLNIHLIIYATQEASSCYLKQIHLFSYRKWKNGIFLLPTFFVFSHKWIKNSYSLQYQTHLLNWSWIKPVRWVLSVLVNSTERWCAAKNHKKQNNNPKTFKKEINNFWWALNCRTKRTKACVCHITENG